MTSRCVILRISNFSDKRCIKKSNKGFTFSIFFFENRTVYEIMWKNMVDPYGAYMIKCEV